MGNRFVWFIAAAGAAVGAYLLRNRGDSAAPAPILVIHQGGGLIIKDKYGNLVNEVDHTLVDGDQLILGASQQEFSFGALWSQTMTLKPNSTATYIAGTDAAFRMDTGTMAHSIPTAGPVNTLLRRYRLHTPGARTAAPGTAYTMSYDPSTHTTRVDVTEGSVCVTIPTTHSPAPYDVPVGAGWRLEFPDNPSAAPVPTQIPQ